MYGHLKNVLGTYRLIEFKRKEYAVELEDVMNADLFVTSGLMFWQRVMQAVHNKVMITLTKEQEDMLSDRDEIPIVGVKKKNGCQPWVERRCFDIACYTQSGTDELSQNDSSGLLCH